MGYVEHCNTHGQYKGDYCGECVEATQLEVEALRAQIGFCNTTSPPSTVTRSAPESSILGTTRLLKPIAIGPGSAPGAMTKSYSS